MTKTWYRKLFNSERSVYLWKITGLLAVTLRRKREAFNDSVALVGSQGWVWRTSDETDH